MIKRIALSGDFFNDDRSCAQYMTINTPNSGFDATVCPPNTIFPPCEYEPATHLTARSRHPGGVNASFGDGSVHFLTDSIDLAAWRGLGSSKGEEPVTLGN